MDPAAEMSALGPKLYARLKELLMPENGDEELAYLLGTPVRDVARMKNGFGPNQQKLLGALMIAGWLNPDVQISSDEAKERAALYAAVRREDRRRRRPNEASPDKPSE